MIKYMWIKFCPVAYFPNKLCWINWLFLSEIITQQNARSQDAKLTEIFTNVSLASWDLAFRWVTISVRKNYQFSIICWVKYAMGENFVLKYLIIFLVKFFSEVLSMEYLSVWHC